MKRVLLWCIVLLAMLFTATAQQRKAVQRLPVLYDAATMSEAALREREKLLAPKLAGRSANVASATRRPWLDANGWRFLRNPAAKFYYELPAGKATLALAEAYAFNGDALLKIEAADAEKAKEMLAFLQQLPPVDLPALADLNVIDDKSPEMDEVLNLLVRRNLLFRTATKPDPRARLNIQLGTKAFPRAAAADPSEFALRVRRQLTDEQRSLRIYGTELVIGQVQSDGQRARVHLVNYSGREIDSLRVRVRGAFTKGTARVFGFSSTELADFTAANGAAEFSLPQMGVYAVVDLSAK